MTIDSKDTNIISDFLIKVTNAETYRELESAYKKVSKDFDEIIKKDKKHNLDRFTNRYKNLEEEARIILNKKINGEQPPPDHIAIFGEMIILRDFCLKRLQDFY